MHSTHDHLARPCRARLVGYWRRFCDNPAAKAARWALWPTPDRSFVANVIELKGDGLTYSPGIERKLSAGHPAYAVSYDGRTARSGHAPVHSMRSFRCGRWSLLLGLEGGLTTM